MLPSRILSHHPIYLNHRPFPQMHSSLLHRAPSSRTGQPSRIAADCTGRACQPSASRRLGRTGCLLPGKIALDFACRRASPLGSWWCVSYSHARRHSSRGSELIREHARRSSPSSPWGSSSARSTRSSTTQSSTLRRPRSCRAPPQVSARRRLTSASLASPPTRCPPAPPSPSPQPSHRPLPLPRALARDACSTGARRPLPVARRGCTRASAGARRVLACLAERAARDARRAGHR